MVRARQQQAASEKQRGVDVWPDNSSGFACRRVAIVVGVQRSSLNVGCQMDSWNAMGSMFHFVIINSSSVTALSCLSASHCFWTYLAEFLDWLCKHVAMCQSICSFVQSVADMIVSSCHDKPPVPLTPTESITVLKSCCRTRKMDSVQCA